MGTAVRRAAIRHVSTWTAWLRQPENALFVLLIAAHLVPIWAFRYFPTQDGGEHLNNANILRRYFTAEGAHFREYFVLNLRPDPNWSGHLVLAALLTVLPAILAEKLFVSAYIVLLPVSARYALRAIRPDAGWLAVLAFPFILNFLLHMGFYNFAFSLPAFFLVVGYWMLHKECIGFRETVVFTGLSLALYFTHPVTYVMASVLVVAAGLGFTLQHACLMAGTRQWHARALWQGFRRRVFTAAYAALPSICLLAAFVGSRSRQPGARAVGMWRRLRTLDTLISYAEPEVRLTAAVAGLFAIVAAYLLVSNALRRRLSRWDWLLPVVGISVAAAFLAPDGMVGGGFISHRLILFPYLIAVLWFGAHTFDRIARIAVQGTAAVLSIAMLMNHMPKYAELNGYLTEYLDVASVVSEGSTFLPLVFSYQGIREDGTLVSSRVGPFIHATGRIAADRNAIELENYEANTDYFPTRWRAERSAYAHISSTPNGVSAQPPCVDFLSYPERTGGSVDYVIVWNATDAMRATECYQKIKAQLDTAYEQVAVSSPRGWGKVYRRRQ